MPLTNILDHLELAGSNGTRLEAIASSKSQNTNQQTKGTEFKLEGIVGII